MMRLAHVLSGALLVLALCAGNSWAHGGSYQGPEGRFGPGYGGPTGGATPSPNPGPRPQPGDGGTTPGNRGGTTGPDPSGGTGPNRPGNRPTGTGTGNRGGGGGRTRSGARKGSGGNRFHDWDWWWNLNEERFLNLKSKVRKLARASDNADIILGEDAIDAPEDLTTRIIRNQLLPVLKLALKDEYYDARSGALIALGKVGDSSQLDLVDTIRSYLADPNKQVRESACLALGILGSTDSTDLLLEILRNSVAGKKAMGRGTSDVLSRTRAFAAVSIGLIGSRGGFGEDDEPLDTLLNLCEWRIGGDRDLAVGPAIGLGLVRSERTIPRMIEIFKNREADAFVRAHIGVALGKVGARGATPALLDGLSDRKTHVRRSAAIALGLLTPPDDRRTVKKIREYAKHARDRATRNFCIMALGEIGSEKGRDTLIDLVNRGRTLHDRTFGALALGVFGFGRTDESRGEIGRFLTEKYKSSRSDSERGAYAVALGLLEHSPAREHLVQVLAQAGHQDLKGHVCTALGLMNDQNSIPAIQALVKQRGDGVLRRRAAIALGLLRDPDAVNTLKEVIETNSRSKGILGAATVALGYIGDRRAVSVLTEMLGKDVSGVYNAKNVTRAFATVALGFLGDKDQIPILSRIQENSNYLAQTPALWELLSIL